MGHDCAVLLAAGSGSRFKSQVPKQLSQLGHEPLFLKSLRTFLQIDSVKQIILVVPANANRLFSSILKRKKLPAKVLIVTGGSYRGASVRNGVRALTGAWETVLIHDTARPLVSINIIQRVIKAAYRSGVALAAWPLPDTLKKSNSRQFSVKTIPRKNLWLAQTPQGFSRKMALKFLLEPSPRATDDVSLAEMRGVKPSLVLGSPNNIKVTYPEDRLVCEALMSKIK